MPTPDQQPNERETQTLRRTGRGLARGLVIGVLLGAVIGLIGGGAFYGWGSTAMWGMLAFGLIGGGIFGWFVGGIATLDDPRRGKEPRPDPDVRGAAEPKDAEPKDRA